MVRFELPPRPSLGLAATDVATAGLDTAPASVGAHVSGGIGSPASRTSSHPVSSLAGAGSDDGAGVLGPLSPLSPASAALSPASRLRRQSTRARLESMAHALVGARREVVVRTVGSEPLGLGLAMDTGTGDAGDEGRAVIIGVVAGSAAAAAQLTPHLFVTAIDGKTTAGLRLGQVQALIRSCIMVCGEVSLEVACAEFHEQAKDDAKPSPPTSTTTDFMT